MKIQHKYNVGDYVRFKDTFEVPTTGLKGREGTVAKITGIAPSYDNQNHYYLNGQERVVYRDTLFAGPATQEEYIAQEKKRLVDVGLEPDFIEPEVEDDVEDDDEDEDDAKWYRISFSAQLTADDLRAMKKCFFDAMNEAMEIYDLEDLVIEEA